MEWIAENWFLLLVLGGCVGMHLLMHRKGHHDHNTTHIDDSGQMQYSLANDTIEEISQHDDELVPTHTRQTKDNESGGCCSHSKH